MIRAEGAGQLKLALILLGDGDRGPGEELDELEQNERERVAPKIITCASTAMPRSLRPL